MSNVFITGSADGLGKMAAQLLVAQGHSVTLHARSPQRNKKALSTIPGATGAIAGDLSSIAATKAVAARANKLGPFDAIIHNAGIGYQERALRDPLQRAAPKSIRPDDEREVPATISKMAERFQDLCRNATSPPLVHSAISPR